MKDPQLVVMAAGIGSRYGGLKQIDPVGPSGEIIIDYALFDALRAGFRRVVFIIRKDIEEAFRERIGRNIENRMEVRYAFQELDKLPEGFSLPPERSKPWGTGHAVLCADDAIDAPFAAINADDFYGASSYESLMGHLSSASDQGGVYDFCMVGFILKNTLTDHGHVARGVCSVDDDGHLESIVERTKIQKFGEVVRFSEDDGETWTDVSPQSVVSMNMWGFTPGYLDELRQRFPVWLKEHAGEAKSEFFVPTVVNELLEEGKARVKVLPCHERWLGVTYPQDKAAVQQAVRDLVRQGEYPESLWGGE